MDSGRKSASATGFREQQGVNFGISLSLWDWLFGTAYWPAPGECPQQQPDALGFPGMETMPRSLPARFVAPLWAAIKRVVGK